MDIRHLKYFVAVVEAQSFTKASEKLFIAQPPLSRQIQDLEKELGLQLLERKSRPIKTTEAGEFFYHHAKRLLSQSEQMIAMTRRIGRYDDVVRIGYTGSLLIGLLPKIVYEFKKRLPWAKVELVEKNTLAQIDSLKKGELDIGFGRLDVSDYAVRQILLRREPLMVAVHKAHPLADFKETGVGLFDVVDEFLLMYPNISERNFATHVLSLFAEQGLSPSNIVLMPQITLALGLAAAG